MEIEAKAFLIAEKNARREDFGTKAYLGHVKKNILRKEKQLLRNENVFIMQKNIL